MMSRCKPLAFLSVWAWLLAGCSGGGTTLLDDRENSPSIAAGSDDIDTPLRNASVLVSFEDRTCTGTLISPLRVLTANHCTTSGTIGDPIKNNLGWKMIPEK